MIKIPLLCKKSNGNRKTIRGLLKPMEKPK